jgi:hypothetical protein
MLRVHKTTHVYGTPQRFCTSTTVSVQTGAPPCYSHMWIRRRMLERTRCNVARIMAAHAARILSWSASLLRGRIFKVTPHEEVQCCEVWRTAVSIDTISCIGRIIIIILDAHHHTEPKSTCAVASMAVLLWGLPFWITDPLRSPSGDNVRVLFGRNDIQLTPPILLSAGWNTTALQLYCSPVVTSVFIWIMDPSNGTCRMTTTFSRPHTTVRSLEIRDVRSPASKHWCAQGQYPCRARSHSPSALRRVSSSGPLLTCVSNKTRTSINAYCSDCKNLCAVPYASVVL